MLCAVVAITLAFSTYRAVSDDSRSPIQVAADTGGRKIEPPAQLGQPSADSSGSQAEVAVGEPTNAAPQTAPPSRSKTSPSGPAGQGKRPVARPPVTGTSTTVPPTVPASPTPTPPAIRAWVRDTTFAGDGSFVDFFGPNGDQAFEMVAQPDGKLVVAGWLAGDRWIDPIGVPADLVVIRLNIDGSWDSSFADGGMFRYDTGGNELPRALLLQPDGKIVVSDGGGLLRLLPNGQRDTAFGSNGYVKTKVVADAVALLPDGRFAVAGLLLDSGGNNLAVTGITSDGGPDAAFGTGGLTVVPGPSGPMISDSAAALAVLDDGGLMLLGTRHGQSSTDTLVARFRGDGLLDPTFNGTGVKVFDFAPVEGGINVLPATAGRAVIGVRAFGQQPQAIVRLLPTGELDPTFGSGGFARPRPTLTALGRDAQGRVLAAVATDHGELQLYRYSSDGVLDPTLVAGAYTSPEPYGAPVPTAVLGLGDGRIVCAGYHYRFNNPASAPNHSDMGWFVERVVPEVAEIEP